LTRPSWRVRAAALVVLAGCTSSAGDASPTTTTIPSTTTTTTTFTGATGSVEIGPPDRPARLVAPDEVTAPAPLVVLLHGYGASATLQDAYLGVTDQASTRGLYVLLPEGTTGPRGRQFWDATDACCNFTGTPVDDVAYLRGLIEEAIETRPVDPARVYVLGHSNGGFMAYRLACDIADDVVAVAVLAGADQLDEADCQPSEAVSVLHIHGTDDETIAYEGGPPLAPGRGAYPGAVDTVARWASRNGCDATPIDRTALDLDAGIDGAETTVRTYDGCPAGVDVQLDVIEGGTHIPRIGHEPVGANVLDWLLAHAR
jgi:polyhydroxybutyrate depolymerase